MILYNTHILKEGKMNKREFIKAMSVGSGLTVKETNKAYDAFLDVVAKTLKKATRYNLPDLELLR